MRPRIIKFLLCAAIAFLASPVCAAVDLQSIPSVGFEAKNCPDEQALKAISGRVSHHAPFTFIIATKPDLYQTAVRSAQKTNVTPPVFEKVAIYAQYADTKRMLD
jgi:hypothetical protein